jgi:hypothetical protein
MSIYAVESGNEYEGIYFYVLFFTLEEAKKYVEYYIRFDKGWKNNDNHWEMGSDYINIEEVNIYETSQEYIQANGE